MVKRIDIHGMTVPMAKQRLQAIIKTAPSNCEITVIHGYHGGQALQKMVRNELKSPRIKRRFLSMNSGETILVIE